MIELQQPSNLVVQLHKRLKELHMPDSMFDDEHFMQGVSLILKGKAVLWIRRKPVGNKFHTNIRIVGNL